MEDITRDTLAIREVRSMRTKIRIEGRPRCRSLRSLEVISGKTERRVELLFYGSVCDKQKKTDNRA